MAEKRRTILMDKDPSKEGWKPSLGKRISRHFKRTIKPRAKKRGVDIDYTPTKTDSFSLGIKGRKRRPRRFEARYKKEF